MALVSSLRCIHPYDIIHDLFPRVTPENGNIQIRPRYVELDSHRIIYQPPLRSGRRTILRASQHSIRFVDIRKKLLHTVSLTDGPKVVNSIQLDEPISVTTDIEGYDASEKILVGLKYGIAILDRKFGTYEYLAHFDASRKQERIRSNDGAVDPNGRFWLGTMTDFGMGSFKAEGKCNTLHREATRK